MSLIEEARHLEKERTKQVTDAINRYFAENQQSRVYVGRFDVGGNKVRPFEAARLVR